MIYKFLLLFFSIFLHLNLISMQSEFDTKQREANKQFFAFLDKKVADGTYEQDKKEKTEYRSKKQHDKVTIETILDTSETIKGEMNLTFSRSDFSFDSLLDLLSPIAILKYIITNNLCTIIVERVEDEYQRQGYGTLLLSALEQELRSWGCKKITLTAAYDNSEKFFSKNGFVKKNRYGRMNKKLKRLNS
jgi:N-acetylglutamate synthase-like GNAT family acetyltransferase